MVQELHREAGCAGRAPTTVDSVTGEAARLVGWIKEANMEVQKLWENWKFLRRTYSQTCTSGINTLSAPVDIGSGMWDLDTFKVTQSGQSVQSPLTAVEYDDVKDEIIDTSTGVPWRVVVMPDNSLRLESTPNGAHLIESDYYREPDEDELTDNDDEPTIPSKFRRIIVGQALIFYANYEGAVEAKTQGQEIYSTYLTRLENSELPNGGKSRYRVGKGQHLAVVAE